MRGLPLFAAPMHNQANPGNRWEERKRFVVSVSKIADFCCSSCAKTGSKPIQNGGCFLNPTILNKFRAGLLPQGPKGRSRRTNLVRFSFITISRARPISQNPQGAKQGHDLRQRGFSCEGFFAQGLPTVREGSVQSAQCL